MKKLIFSVIVGLWMVFVPVIGLYAQEGESSNGGSGRYGSDSLTCIMNISLYREFFKQWKSSGYESETVKDAITPWRWVFMNCPKGTENTYIDGAKIMAHMVEHANDSTLRSNYIDTLMMVYDQRIVYFGKEGSVLARKGIDLYNYRPADFETVYNTLKKSVSIEGNKTMAPILVFYMQSTIDMIRCGKADTATVFEVYDTSMEIIEHNMIRNAENEKEKANWEVVRGNMELALEPYATCKDIVAIFTKKYEANPDDLELLKKISGLLDKKKCQDDALYFTVTKKLYELEPSPSSAYLIGKMLLKEEKYSEAINYLKEAEKMEDQETVSKSCKYIAESYRYIKNYPAARTYALKAASLNPADGEPYLIIGDLYAESAPDCGDNELTKRVAYWAAVDKYYRAKQVDPSQAAIADQRIAAYSVYFPTMETIFFYNMKEGETYQVECWIQEETRVRASR